MNNIIKYIFARKNNIIDVCCLICTIIKYDIRLMYNRENQNKKYDFTNIKQALATENQDQND